MDQDPPQIFFLRPWVPADRPAGDGLQFRGELDARLAGPDNDEGEETSAFGEVSCGLSPFQLQQHVSFDGDGILVGFAASGIAATPSAAADCDRPWRQHEAIPRTK